MEEGVVDIVEITIDAEGKSVSSTIAKDVCSIIPSKPDLFADYFPPEHVKDFIEEMKNHPALWKLSLSSRKNNSLRENSWKEISEVFTTKETVLRKQWQDITDSYARCRNQTHLKSRSYTAGGKLPLLLPKTCLYYDELSFLKGGFLMTSDLQEEGVYSPPSTPPSPPITLPSTVSPSNNITQKRKHTDINNTQLVTAMRRHEEDSDMLFCKSLAGTLRELPKKRNALMKVKIQEILFKAQFDESFDCLDESC